MVRISVTIYPRHASAGRHDLAVAMSSRRNLYIKMNFWDSQYLQVSDNIVLMLPILSANGGSLLDAT